MPSNINILGLIVHSGLAGPSGSLSGSTSIASGFKGASLARRRPSRRDAIIPKKRYGTNEFSALRAQWPQGHATVSTVSKGQGRRQPNPFGLYSA